MSGLGTTGATRSNGWSRSSLARFVEFRKQFAEVHPSGKLRYYDQVGTVPEAIAISFLQPASMRIGYSHMRYAELELFGNLRQHVAQFVIGDTISITRCGGCVKTDSAW